MKFASNNDYEEYLHQEKRTLNISITPRRRRTLERGARDTKEIKRN